MSRIMYDDEHEIINRYAGLTELLSGAKAQDPVAMRGAVCRGCAALAATRLRALSAAERAELGAEEQLRRLRSGTSSLGEADLAREIRTAEKALERATNRLAVAQLDQVRPGTRTEVKTKDHETTGRQRYRAICSRCGDDWEGSEVPVFKGEIDTGRRIGATSEWIARMVDEYRRIEPIMEHRPSAWELRRWRFARLATLARHHGGIGSFGVIVEAGQAVAPEFGAWWRYEIVRYWVRRFEEKIRARGERDGLLRRRGVV